MSWRNALAMLKHNYGVRRIGREDVAGRSAEILEFHPEDEALPVQAFWIDRETGLILQRHAYLKDGSWDYRSHFIRLDLPAELSPDRFKPSLPEEISLVKKPLEPTFFSPEEIAARFGAALDVPESLPQGFHFESGGVRTLNGAAVAHLRYTDGINVVSVFQSTGTTPFKAPAQAERLKIGGQPGWLCALEEQKILGWRDARRAGPSAGRQVVLIGSISREALVRMAEAFAPAVSQTGKSLKGE